MSNSTVTVYSKPSCVQCTATYRALANAGIEHRVIDITQDDEAYAFVKGLGYMAAPVVVAGDLHWSGYRQDMIEQIAA